MNIIQKIKTSKLNLTGLIIILFTVFLMTGVFIIWKNPDSLTFAKQNASQDLSEFSGYFKGRVVQVISEETSNSDEQALLSQELQIEITSGEHKGENILVSSTSLLDKAGGVKLAVGDKVVLGKIKTELETEVIAPAEGQYVVVDRYRLPGVLWVVLLFVLVAILVAGRHGAASLFGLVLTFLALVYFVVPQLLSGSSVLFVTLVFGVLVLIVTMLISHGFNLRTKLSILSTIITLFFATAFSFLFLETASLFGLGQADAFLLQNGFLGSINLRGILLAGIIIACLGVLDDVTTSQTAVVEEIFKVDPTTTFKDLFFKGMSVGREHIASLINTLVLVYAGASLPLFLLIVSSSSQPLWVLFNSEYFAEEIIRAISGSVALIIAVPISTALAAWYFTKR